MSLFKHPHLTRGIVRTPSGAFVVSRGLVDAPEDVGAALGWKPVDEEDTSAKPRRDDGTKKN
jgi:hypothetical protein